MPEGPEVRKWADAISEALESKQLIEISARTKNARAWLATHGNELVGKKVLRVFAHGKNVIGLVEGDYFFYAHQMMWGRWQILHTLTPPAEKDKRERARIVVSDATALLMSAPVFEVGHGDPYELVDVIKNLGPNILTYGSESFDSKEFLKRLKAPRNKQRTIGDALLDQTIAAGIGNYLRADIMFLARMNPWKKVGELKKKDFDVLAQLVPEVTKAAYEKGFTVSGDQRERMTDDSNLVYVPGKEYGTRHYVFRRTNLPCLVCEEPIRQLRQVVSNSIQQEEGDEEERTRIVYFCSNCQSVPATVFEKPKKKRA